MTPGSHCGRVAPNDDHGSTEPDGIVTEGGDRPPEEKPPPGDGTVPKAPPASDDVIPIAGDGDLPPPQAPGTIDLGHGAGNPFVEDDDDDDDDDDADDNGRSPWRLLAILIAAVAVTLIAFLYFTSGSSKGPVRTASTPSSTASTTTSARKAPSGCPPPLQLEHLDIGSMSSECAGPAQYKSDPRNKYYSYFAWELSYHGHDVQLVVTGGALTMPVTSKVSPDVAAVSASGTKLADVDLYDNGTQTKNFASSGSVGLNPNGAVVFDDVHVKFDGANVEIHGRMDPLKH